jgi:hypothetical protein
MNHGGNRRRKALHIGVLGTISASLVLLLFQNCQKPTAVAEGTSTASQTSETNSDTNTSTIADVSTSPTSYAPIGFDSVCNDIAPDKKAIINTYIRLLHRCVERPSLDYWYSAQLRLGSSIVSQLESGIKSWPEYQNLNVAGQTPSKRYCLPGDTFQILTGTQILTSAELDAVQSTDTRNFTVTCRTSVPQNLSSSQSQIVRDTMAVASASDPYVCAVVGDTLRNHIIDMYIQYLDRCPESSGLEFWAKSWPGDSNWIALPEVQGYLKCRYQNGVPSTAPINSIDACYKSKFNFTLCPGTNVQYIRYRWCEKTGS